MKGKPFEIWGVYESFPREDMKEGVVYHCDAEKRIDLLCPCGCGDQITLNTIQTTSPKWRVMGNSIMPSINRIVGCKSHFRIVNGIVQ